VAYAILTRAIGSWSGGRQAEQRPGSACHRRSHIQLEALETRNLLSIAGVTLQFGNLAIKAPNSSGNVAKVWIDSATHNVAVSLNGQTEEFAAASVANITYTGGAKGGDTFTNSTSLLSLDYGYGGSNKFTGGTSYNFVYFFGNNNKFSAVGGFSDVWKGYGSGDTITDPPGATVVVYNN
jgi:hypothetical protein